MLSANIVAQNPCDNTSPALLPGQDEADIIIGGGASAAEDMPAADDRPTTTAKEKYLIDWFINGAPAAVLHKRGRAGWVSCSDRTVETIGLRSATRSVRPRLLPWALCSHPSKSPRSPSHREQS